MAPASFLKVIIESDYAINAISDKRRVVIRGVAIRPVAIKGVVISKGRVDRGVLLGACR